MPLSKIRFILAVLSFLALTGIYKLAGYNPHLLIATNAVFLLFWMATGPVTGVLFTFLSVILFWNLMSDFGQNLAILYAVSFLISSATGFFFNRKINRLEQFSMVRLEKLEGDANELFSDLRHKIGEGKAMKARLKKLSNLKVFIERFSSTLEQNRIIHIIVDTSNEIIERSDRSLLYMIDTSSQELRLLYSRREKDLPPVKVKHGDIFDRWVLKQRKPLLVEDAYNDFRFYLEKDSKAHFNSLISAPFMSQDKATGIIRMDSLKKNFYSQEDLRLLDIISDLGTVALENATLYKRVEELAITDGLTGLYVQKYFRDRLKRETERALRSDNHFALIILDIDDFKAYNDKYGHVSGDLVLKYIASLIKSKMEPGDIAARYGGEEFAVIMLKKGKEEALAEANRILDELKSKPLILRRAPTSLTASMGIALFPDDAKLDEDLIKCADGCLYKAKKEGKNRACSK